MYMLADYALKTDLASSLQAIKSATGIEQNQLSRLEKSIKEIPCLETVSVDERAFVQKRIAYDLLQCIGSIPLEKFRIGQLKLTQYYITNKGDDLAREGETDGILMRLSFCLEKLLTEYQDGVGQHVADDMMKYFDQHKDDTRKLYGVAVSFWEALSYLSDRETKNVSHGSKIVTELEKDKPLD